MLSNVFPILCYTKDNAPIPSILCLSAISSPEMSHLCSPLPLRIISMSKGLISMSSCHASSSYSLPKWRLSFCLLTSCDVGEHRCAHLRPCCEEWTLICLQCCCRSQALSIQILAPGKREEHNSEQNRKTDKTNKNKNKMQRNREIII